VACWTVHEEALGYLGLMLLLEVKTILKTFNHPGVSICHSGTLGLNNPSEDPSDLGANLLVHIQIENPKGISQALMFAQQPIRQQAHHSVVGAIFGGLKWMWMRSIITCSITCMVSLSEC